MRKVGSPAGIAEIAVVMPSRITALASSPRQKPRATMMATATQATMASRTVRVRISLRSGESVCLTALSIPAILPISVVDPVAVTM